MTVQESCRHELFNRKRWTTRVELSTAIFDWIEVFDNRTRRHSSLNMLSPVAYEKLHATTPVPPDSQERGTR
jgi:putative transposase